MICFELLILCSGIYTSYAYGIFYIFQAYPIIYTSIYDFNAGEEFLPIGSVPPSPQASTYAGTRSSAGPTRATRQRRDAAATARLPHGAVLRALTLLGGLDSTQLRPLDRAHPRRHPVRHRLPVPVHGTAPVSTSSGMLLSGSLSFCVRFWQNLLLALSFVPCLMNANGIAHIIKLKNPCKLHAHGTPSFSHIGRSANGRTVTKVLWEVLDAAMALAAKISYASIRQFREKNE